MPINFINAAEAMFFSKVGTHYVDLTTCASSCILLFYSTPAAVRRVVVVRSIHTHSYASLAFTGVWPLDPSRCWKLHTSYKLVRNASPRHLQSSGIASGCSLFSRLNHMELNLQCVFYSKKFNTVICKSLWSCLVEHTSASISSAVPQDVWTLHLFLFELYQVDSVVVRVCA